jgi:hypothetical protein
MAKPHALRLFLRIAPELSFQSQIGEVLKAMVNEHILERGPKEGTAHTYRVNPAYPGIQGVYNRKLG